MSNYICTYFETKLRLSYKAKLLHKLEVIQGKLDENAWGAVRELVSHNESEARVKYSIPNFSIEPEAPAKPKSLYMQMLSAYYTWYEGRNGVVPRINAAEGSALKQLIAYLHTICTTDQEVVDTWLTLLSHWNKLDEFYKKQQELRQINSNINHIIRTVKNGTSETKRDAENHANDFRARF